MESPLGANAPATFLPEDPMSAARLPELPRGAALLRDPALNKGGAFTADERAALALDGLLPSRVYTIEEQVGLVLENLRRLPTPLEKYIALEGLHNRNETLFFRTIVDHPDEIVPLVYTPTVGAACQQFSRIVQRPRGLFITPEHRGRVAEVLRNWPYRDVAIIVVTDGGRILGLGDLGANGMGIPIGKLVLYSACAGVEPTRTLPVTLDVGTNTESVLADPLYCGTRRRRIERSEYDALVEEFVAATQEVFPGVLIQFEDFANVNAFRLLARYRDRVCAFNDDVQGTGAVVLSGLLCAMRATGGRLADQRVLCLGAGGAATGLCNMVSAALAIDGLPEAEARRRLWMFDTKGLVVAGRSELAEHKRPFAHEHPPVASFLDAVKALRPTAIVGVSTAGGAFTEEVLKAMAVINSRPIVLALSNPTAKSECTAEQAYRATEGRALFASGSPFDPVTLAGATRVPRQCNNSYVFPGVGLGAIACGARRVTDEMFLAAARTLAAQVSDADLAQGSLYPPLARVREVSARIAAAVAEVAYARGLATRPRPADVLEDVRRQMYRPEYRACA
jgi:malate dehydrogenase (oxaloacetate-decarboxylating)(NADP+)